MFVVDGPWTVGLSGDVVVGFVAVGVVTVGAEEPHGVEVGEASLVPWWVVIGVASVPCDVAAGPGAGAVFA